MHTHSKKSRGYIFSGGSKVEEVFELAGIVVDICSEGTVGINSELSDAKNGQKGGKK